MMPPSKFNLMVFASRMGMVAIGLVILATSVIRTSWKILAQDELTNTSQNNNVEYMVAFDDGQTFKGSYSLPVSGMLPDNVFYGIKRFRDLLWLRFSGGENRAMFALHLADKSASEARELLLKNNYQLALASGIEAMDKLEYAEKLIQEVKVQDERTKKLHYQIFWAGHAYKNLFVDEAKNYSLDDEQFKNLINRFDEWNKTQEENRSSWGF